MKKLVLSVLAFTLVFGIAGALQAKVVFLPNDRASVGTQGTGGQGCVDEGFRETSATCDGELLDVCSSNGAYFKFCCPRGYKHTKEECVSNAKPLSGDHCHGYYKCD